VIVTVDVPATAVALAFSVRTRVDGVGPLLIALTTPAGRPETAKATTPVKPFCGASVRTVLPLAPCWMLRAGELASVNVGGSTIESATIEMLVRSPEVPVMVTVAEPADAVLAAVRVILLRPAITAPKLAVTPAGRPEATSATGLLNP
jgi:hypothetical protein